MPRLQTLSKQTSGRPFLDTVTKSKIHLGHITKMSEFFEMKDWPNKLPSDAHVSNIIDTRQYKLINEAEADNAYVVMFNITNEKVTA
jgi:hypothetical protein